MGQTLYFDYCASTPLAAEVIEEMTRMFTHFGNPSSAHRFGWFAAEKITIAREQVAAAVAARSEEIIFTSGATEANNLAIFGVAEAFPGCHIVSVVTEHSAVLDPLRELERRGFRVSLLDVDAEGFVSADSLRQALRDDTRLVSIMLANNEIGSLQRISELSAICRERGVLFHCDAVQALGRLPLDVTELGVDMLSLSAHKCYGPKGVGTLYRKAGVPLVPLLFGGGHESGLRGGTLNTLGIVGFGKAAELAAAAAEADGAKAEKILSSLHQQLQEALGEEIPLNGPTEASAARRLPGLRNISLPGVSNERLLAKLQTKLAFSLASACQSGKKQPSHVLAALALPPDRLRSSIRLSAGRYSSLEEAHEAAQLFTKALKSLK